MLIDDQMKQKGTSTTGMGNAIVVKLGLDKNYMYCEMEFLCIMFFTKKISFPVIKRMDKA